MARTDQPQPNALIISERSLEQAGAERRQLTLLDILRDIRLFDRLSFIELHGERFLVFQGARSDIRHPERPWQRTCAAGERRVGQGVTTLGSVVVQGVRHTGRSATPLFITIGRCAASNDVVVLDESVSLFHAYFQRGSDGEYFLLDAKSSNGTYVNERKLNEGEPARMNNGDKIRCGSIVMTFYDVDGLLRFGATIGLS